MSIAAADALRSSLTDKYVIVRAETPELRRFSGLTGQVKTVNMNGRALVQFDGAVDISWYDIDPSFLSVIDAPLPKVKESAPEKAAKPAPAKKSSPAAKGGGSPLDMIRKGGAAKPAADTGGAKQSPLDAIRKGGAAKPAGDAGGEKKGSPLDQIRKAGAPKSEPAVEETPAVEAPAETKSAAPADDDTKGLSPLEIIRRQAAKKGK